MNLVEYACRNNWTFRCIDVIYHLTVIVEYLFCANSKKGLKDLNTFSLVVVHDIARILKKRPFLFKSFYFVVHARSSLFFPNIYFQHSVCSFL